MTISQIQDGTMDLDVDNFQDSDNETHFESVVSGSLGAPSRSESVETFNHYFDDAADLSTPSLREKPSKASLTLDLLDQMSNTYRLLDLIYEQGSGGAGM